MSEFQKQVHAALKTVPGFEQLSTDDYRFERLSGLTNLVFRIDTGTDRFVLRIPGKGTEEYIDRKVEIHNARVAASAGVSAEVMRAYCGGEPSASQMGHMPGPIEQQAEDLEPV